MAWLLLNNSLCSSNRYADLGDIFSEVGDISATPASAASLSKLQRQIPTPNSSIAIPRPPSRRSEQIRAGRVSPAAMARADSVGSLEFRTAGVGLGSRGPSPLTIGMSDTIPLAIAFHEIIHAFFKWVQHSESQQHFNLFLAGEATNLDVRWRCLATWCSHSPLASSTSWLTIQIQQSSASASRTFRISKIFCRISNWSMCK